MLNDLTVTDAENSRDMYWLVFLLLISLALRVVYLSEDRFHADEALYAGWALHAIDDDILLLTVPIDKPPLYLYMLAASIRMFGRSEVATRLPNLAASIIGITLIYKVGQRLYGPATARWAVLFLAFSPFDILFARTAFTDPVLVMWELLALYAVLTNRKWYAGTAAGMAFATKQHAVFSLPLLITLELIYEFRHKTTHSRQALPELIVRQFDFLWGLLIPVILVTWWDSFRWPLRPGYLQQSTMSYGGLSWTPWAEWIPRFCQWQSWARYWVGSLFLYLVLIAGAIMLFTVACRHRIVRWLDKVDIILVGYGFTYLLIHTIVRLSIWDRYLLPLAPLASLVMARTVRCTSAWLERQAIQSRRFWLLGLRTAFFLAILASLLFSGIKAAFNRYPVGGEHWAYQGIDQIALYLHQNASPDAVLYHHWLRWHYSYYLYGAELELRWWESGEHLKREVLRTPDRDQYIVLPDWRSKELLVDGITLEPISETRRRDGSISFRLYRIKPTNVAQVRASALSVLSDSRFHWPISTLAG